MRPWRSGAAAAALAAALLAPGAARAQTSAPPAAPAPKSARPPAGAKPARGAKPPVDFTGIWVLDTKASQGVTPTTEGAVLSVRQNGNRIWIQPIEQKGPNLLAEEIVVDGRVYEKAVGRAEKGTLVAAWGKDKTSLWLEANVGTERDPHAGAQRMIWRLRDGGKVWTRQTRTLQGNELKETFLVFRKREEAKPK